MQIQCEKRIDVHQGTNFKNCFHSVCLICTEVFWGGKTDTDTVCLEASWLCRKKKKEFKFPSKFSASCGSDSSFVALMNASVIICVFVNVCLLCQHVLSPEEKKKKSLMPLTKTFAAATLKCSTIFHSKSC